LLLDWLTSQNSNVARLVTTGMRIGLEQGAEVLPDRLSKPDKARLLKRLSLKTDGDACGWF